MENPNKKKKLFCSLISKKCSGEFEIRFLVPSSD